MQVVIFRVGTEYFALEGDRVGGIVEEEKNVTDAQTFGRHIIGFLNLEEQIVPILPFYETVQIMPPEEGYSNFILIVHKDKWVAIPVEETEKHCDLGQESFHPLPQVAQSGGNGYIRQIASHNGRLILLLDADKLVADLAGDIS